MNDFPKILLTSTYSKYLHPSQLTCISKKAIGTSSGSLLIQNNDTIFDTKITNSSIFDILSFDSVVYLGTGESSLFKYDLNKFNSNKLYCHTKSINRIKKRNENIFYTGSKDGTVCCWDRRTDSIVHRLSNNSGSVLAIEPNENVVYVTTANGGILNIYDERYFCKGNVECTSIKISNLGIVDIKRMGGYLLALFANGKIVRLGEMGLVGCEIYHIKNFSCLKGQIEYVDEIDCLIFVSLNGLHILYLMDYSVDFYSCEGINQIERNRNKIRCVKNDGTIEILNIKVKDYFVI